MEGSLLLTGQVVIDQFVSGSEQKWNQSCGLVLLLLLFFFGGLYSILSVSPYKDSARSGALRLSGTCSFSPWARASAMTGPASKAIPRIQRPKLQACYCRQSPVLDHCLQLVAIALREAAGDDHAAAALAAGLPALGAGRTPLAALRARPSRPGRRAGEPSVAEGTVSDLVMVLKERNERGRRQMSADLAAPLARAKRRSFVLVGEPLGQTAGEMPRRIVLDVDDTFDAAHGGQQLAFWNAHHDERGFASMHIYHVASGTPIALLTNGTVRDALGFTSRT